MKVKFIFFLPIMFFSMVLHGQSFEKDLSKMSTLLLNTNSYQFHISTIYFTHDSKQMPGDDYDLFKVGETTMARIGNNRMMSDLDKSITVSLVEKNIVVDKGGKTGTLEDYLQELDEQVALGVFENVIFSNLNGKNIYQIKNPSIEIETLKFVFSKRGMLEQVNYQFKKNIQGNPYDRMQIDYAFIPDSKEYHNMGLNWNDYLTYSKGYYKLTAKYADFDFTNLKEE